LTGIGDSRMLPKPRHPVSSHLSDRVLNASSNIRLTQAWGDCPVSILVKRIFVPVFPIVLAIMVCQPRHCQGQDQEKARPDAAAKTVNAEAPEPAQAPAPDDKAIQGQPGAGDLDSPKPVSDEKLVDVLRTVPVRRDHARRSYNYQMINTALLPRDKEGIWVLDFAFKPLRIRPVPIPGKGRRSVHYLYCKVVNRTGQPRRFVPQFTMVNEEGKKFEDQVIPEAIPLIQAREDPTIPVLGAVSVMGIIPPSTKEGVDDAVFGAAVWDNWDPKSDRFSIYVRGLSDGYKEVPNPAGGKPIVKYKTLRIDFIRRGDERNISEKEIEFNDPAYEWVYW
jgi:hypothetical protein